MDCMPGMRLHALVEEERMLSVSDVATTSFGLMAQILNSRNGGEIIHKLRVTDQQTTVNVGACIKQETGLLNSLVIGDTGSYVKQVSL